MEVRDSGLQDALLGSGDLDALFGHPVIGASWEGFVIENLLANCRAQDLDPEEYLTEVLKRLPHNATPSKPPSAKQRPKRRQGQKPSKLPDHPPAAPPEQR